MTLGEINQNTALLVCGHVFRKEREIRLVRYDEDGPQATCDLTHESSEAETDAKLIALKHLFEWEAGLEFLRELTPGQSAWKTGPESWKIENTEE